jgi:hypothetical protein
MDSRTRKATFLHCRLAIADDEIYSRPAGELLQSNRDSMQALEATKREIGSRNFAAQYLQNPTPPDGNMIKSSGPRFLCSNPIHAL